jgi:hypothetical protein
MKIYTASAAPKYLFVGWLMAQAVKWDVLRRSGDYILPIERVGDDGGERIVNAYDCDHEMIGAILQDERFDLLPVDPVGWVCAGYYGPDLRTAVMRAYIGRKVGAEFEVSIEGE